MKCTSCAGSGEDFNEGDTCFYCGGSGDLSDKGPMAGKSVAFAYLQKCVARDMENFYKAFSMHSDERPNTKVSGRP